MLTSLKFVQGSIAKKDFVPSLTHFVIEDGRVRGYNGVIALCSPIPFNIPCKPKGETLVRAISNCEGTVSMSLTAGGRLSIKSGKFKAFVDCVEGETPHAIPEGETVQLDGESILKAVKTIHPFIGNDASRPWSNGVLFTGESAFATNNVTLVEYWTGAKFPTTINVPKVAIREMLRINEAPVFAQLNANSLTLHYTGERWLRTQLLETKWPDLSKVLNRESNPTPIEPKIFEGLEIIKPFVEKTGKIFFNNGVSTHESEAEGASYDIDNFPHTGLYNLDMLKLLEGTAQTIDWGNYPGPCMFFGERLRGAIIGMRK
jgi:DNA polymerase III sliding clamp (beta) subunit (PCNA family)